MPVQEIELTPKLSAFVEAQVSEGNYANPSEVLSTALEAMARIEKEHAEKTARFHSEIQKGVDDMKAGRYTTISSKEELREMLDGCYERAMERLRNEENAEVLG